MKIEIDGDADLREVVQALSVDFDEQCDARHLMGAEKYGPVKFITADTFQEMIEEIIDFANYARYTYIKLRLYQIFMEQQAKGSEYEEPAAQDFDLPGMQGWKAANEEKA